MGTSSGGGPSASFDGGQTGADGAVAGGSAKDAASGGAATCDRPCLLAMMDTYLEALVARDPSKIVVASTVK
jgi:hypothetical protein